MAVRTYLKAFVNVGFNYHKPGRFGLIFDTVHFLGSDYLTRLRAYAVGTLRLHKFHRGDDDRAPHDHPWWFITFPFTSYTERYWTAEEEVARPQHPVDAFFGLPAPATNPRLRWVARTRVVKAWRFHFRPAKFRHFVIGRADGLKKPFWTFVIAGFASNNWGFWRTPTEFVPHKEWDRE